MKHMKIILSLLLAITLSTTTFAGGPHHHPDNHHHHHSSYHSYNDTRNTFLALLGITAFTTAIIAGANAASKKSKKAQEKEIIEQHYEQVSQDLTLNEKQQDQIKVVLDASREKITPLREQKDLKSAALEQEKAKENPNEETINSLETEISDLSRQIYKITQNTKSELKIILLPAQYKIIDDMKI